LSLEDFFLAFRRFVARRALPKTLYSDNAPTFKAAKSLLEAHYGKEIVLWKNICPLSPNWGGWWERLVRSVKSSLKKTVGRSLITRKTLETILPEIEACVNSRPLTYIAEQSKVLTPSHFLIGRGTPFDSCEVDKFEQMVNLLERNQIEESITKQFWEFWKTEYLRNLPPLTHKSKKTSNNLKTGSVVLIKNEKKPRLIWSLGKVNKLFKGIDGRVRAVELKTEKGILIRSINHLCLLEEPTVASPLDVTLTGKSGDQNKESDSLTDKDLDMESELVSSDVSYEKHVGTRLKDSCVQTRSGRTVKPVKRMDV